MEGDIGVCGVAVLANFSCGISVSLLRSRCLGSSRNAPSPTLGEERCVTSPNNRCGDYISVILILNCGIAVFSKPAGRVFVAFWSTIVGIKNVSFTFSDHF